MRMINPFISSRAPCNRATGIYIAATLVLTAISLLFWLTGFSDRHSPFIRFIFFDPGVPGSDLTLHSRLLGWRESGALVFNPPGTISPFNYCPFSLFLIVFFLKLPHPPVALAAFVGFVVLLSGFLLAKTLGQNRLALAALITALCTSFPFGLLFERGNIEGLLWISCAAGTYYFVRGNYLAAALLIALAASIKPFPGLLLLLLLPKRRYREFLIGIAAVVALTAGSLMIIGPTLSIAMREFLNGFKVFTKGYVTIYNSSEFGSDHSLFSLIKMLIRAAVGWPRQGHGLNEIIHGALPYYLLFAALIIAVSLYRLRILPVLNQVFGLSVLIVLVSPTNHDYALIAMYIPWAILLLALGRPGCRIPFVAASWLMICCAIIFTSQFYLLFGLSTSLGAQVKTLALCAILIISAICPLPATELDESPA